MRGWLCGLLLLLTLGTAQAATHTAASCFPGAVQTAMNAASAGDTVAIPAGTCAWSSTVDWTAPANVRMLGAGNLTVLGGGDATILVDNVASGDPLISVTTNATGTFRLAGLTVRGGTGAIKESGMVSLGGASQQVRVDHITVDKTTYTVGNGGKLLYVGGRVMGVLDHSLFHYGNEIGWIHIVNGDIGTAADNGDVPWSEATNFGSAQFFYIEDNQFLSGSGSGGQPPLATVTDCHTAGRHVVRYNTGVNVNVGQTHPTGHAGDDRGCRAHEIYGNTITSTVNPEVSEPNFSFEYTNSGPSLIWGNAADGVYKNMIIVNICMEDSECGYTPPYNGWGVSCGNSNPWDGNYSGQNGYPCIDQPGRGQGDLLTGNFPSKINTAFGTAIWPRQKLEPVYEWLTTGTTVTGWGGDWFNNGSTGGRIQENRDIYLHHANTGCNPGAGSCTTGVGVGTLAQRPVNCTTTTEPGGGVAWWATDQGGNWHSTNGTGQDGALYMCTATNTWTLYYTPYTYPHPLVTADEPPMLSPPTLLRIVR